LLKAIQRAIKLDYDVGVITNGYFARTAEVGMRFLRPLALMGVKDIRISNDFLHYKNPDKSPAKRALKAAKKLGIPTTLVHTAHPGIQEHPGKSIGLADNVLEKHLILSGRAGETLSEGLPTSNWQEFTSCPRSDLTDPEEVFIDAYGCVQICPGITIGNAWEVPLHEIIENFGIQSHAIIRLLKTKGPSGLMKDSTIPPDAEYVSNCHCCYSIRRDLIDSYPVWFAPRQVYGF
jgi:hypothetical protein